ncbi:MAG: hypothetical protein KIS87_00190 [Phycisphaeraceae bacterium]|nr:hypothetical protein [Phycisphaeraceae bacterium]
MRAFLWRTLGRWAFRLSPHVANGWRRTVLRAFGARLAPNMKVRRSVAIDSPWLLSVGSLTVIGDRAALRGGGRITIGDRCVVSQLAIVTTEARDPAEQRHPVRRGDIVLEDDCWLAADALAMPGTRLRAGTVVGARSLVHGDSLPGWTVAAGQPARPMKKREFVNAVST